MQAGKILLPLMSWRCIYAMVDHIGLHSIYIQQIGQELGHFNL